MMQIQNYNMNPMVRINSLMDTAKMAKLDDHPAIKNLILAAVIDDDFELFEDIEPILNLKAVYESLKGPFATPSEEDFL